jgi:predicted metal-dependent peptidase
MNAQAKDRIEKGFFWLLNNFGLFADRIIKLKKVETYQQDTMAISQQELFYNPDYTLSLEIYEFKFVLLHEIVHLKLLHHIRILALPDAKLPI